jgi:two-component system, LytTR family, response regulator
MTNRAASLVPGSDSSRSRLARDEGGGPSLRILVVDDEPLARARVRRLLEREPRVSAIDEARSGAEAIRLIEQCRPDLVFLDVQMPKTDGFGVIEQVGADRMPPVVFVTAYDQYALQAFEVHALDYLLKPFTQERFGAAVARALAAIDRAAGEPTLNASLRALVKQLSQPRPYLDRIAVTVGGRLVPLCTDDIDWIATAGKYIVLHAGSAEHLVREPMQSIQGKLDPRRFVRIHRQAIVNLDRIAEIQPMFHGECAVLLKTGARLTLGRAYRNRFHAIFNV